MEDGVVGIAALGGDSSSGEDELTDGDGEDRAKRKQRSVDRKKKRVMSKQWNQISIGDGSLLVKLGRGKELFIVLEEDMISLIVKLVKAMKVSVSDPLSPHCMDKGEVNPSSFLQLCDVGRIRYNASSEKFTMLFAKRQGDTKKSWATKGLSVSPLDLESNTRHTSDGYAKKIRCQLSEAHKLWNQVDKSDAGRYAADEVLCRTLVARLKGFCGNTGPAAQAKVLLCCVCPGRSLVVHESMGNRLLCD